MPQTGGLFKLGLLEAGGLIEKIIMVYMEGIVCNCLVALRYDGFIEC